jgi:hypothetical protein
MNDSLVTIATYSSPLEANLARNCLAESGIEAFLMGEEAVAMAWMLSNAVGGIKLQVAEVDEVKALALLDSLHDDAEDLPTLERDGAFQPVGNIQAVESIEIDDGEDDDDPPPSGRERAADRVCMIAVLSLLLLAMPSMGMGLFFLALQVWMFWQLIHIYQSDELLRTRYRLRAILAACICIPYVAVVGLFLQTFLVSR